MFGGREKYSYNLKKLLVLIRHLLPVKSLTVNL